MSYCRGLQGTVQASVVGSHNIALEVAPSFSVSKWLLDYKRIPLCCCKAGESPLCISHVCFCFHHRWPPSCCHFLNSNANSTLNMVVQKSPQHPVLMTLSVIVACCNNSGLSFWRNLHSVFHNSCQILQSISIRVLISSHLYQHWLYSGFCGHVILRVMLCRGCDVAIGDFKHLVGHLYMIFGEVSFAHF